MASHGEREDRTRGGEERRQQASRLLMNTEEQVRGSTITQRGEGSRKYTELA